MHAVNVCDETADKEGIGAQDADKTMDPQSIQEKVETFAQRLLSEAHGDPIRALGLLVLVLDTAEFESVEHMQRLITEVRHALMSEERGALLRPIQHLAGEVSWEGIQHCLRCGKVLARDRGPKTGATRPGYVYEQGTRLISDDQDDFSLCTDDSV